MQVLRTRCVSHGVKCKIGERVHVQAKAAAFTPGVYSEPDFISTLLEWKKKLQSKARPSVTLCHVQDLAAIDRENAEVIEAQSGQHLLLARRV